MESLTRTHHGIFIGAFAIGLSGALMPGPVLFATMGSATYWGALAGPLIILGHGLLELAVVVAVVLGFGKVLERPSFLGAIGLIGGAALLWMGAGMMADAGSVSLNVSAGQTPYWLIRHPIAAGVILSACNPYFIFWWATIGIAYIAKSRALGRSGMAAFYTGHILSDLAWYSLVAVGVALGAHLISDRTLQGMIRVCSVVLIAFGVYFAGSGVLHLRRISR